MPLHVIPIEHKFGIISRTHKKQLQERLIRKRKQLEKELQLKKERNEKYFYQDFKFCLTDEKIIIRYNVQITEEFVTKYNESHSNEKQNLDEQCHKMLEKIKVDLCFQSLLRIRL